MSSVEIMNWGKWRVAWVQSSDIQVAIDALMRGEADGLGFSSYKGFNGNDISFLKDLSRELTGLVFPLAGGFNLEILEQIEKLQYLAISDSTASLDLRHMKSLEDLSLDWHSRYHLPSANSQLQRLGLKRYNSKDLEKLPDYGRLEVLNLVQGNLVSMAGVERFTSLKQGDFAYLTKLVSLQDLAKTGIETLVFESCKKAADDLEALSKCRNLKMLGFHNGGELKSLKFLDTFKSLEEFRFVKTKITDGDMTPLLKLKRIGFLKQRGYSHTPEQIREMIGEPPLNWDQTKLVKPKPA